MIYKTKHITLAICAVLGLAMAPRSALAQTTYEQELNTQIVGFLAPLPKDTTRVQSDELFPNDASTTMLVPSGFGGSGRFVFGGIGGAYPEVYTKHKTDLAGAVGFCIGDPARAVNFAASLNVGSVHRFTDFSGNFTVSRSLSNGNSLSAGVLQLLASSHRSDAPDASYFVAYSHAVQWLPSLTPGSSRLSYTIGVGTGRFYKKSPQDILAGRGAHGTAVFASVAYELIQHVNVIAEWTGTNLGFAASVRPFKLPVSFGVGVTNLTRYSANKQNLVFSAGIPLSLTRTRN